MNYAIRKDGLGWRSVNSHDDVDNATETLSYVPPKPTQEALDSIKSQQANSNIQKISLDMIPQIIAYLATLQNSPQAIKDADASIKSESAKVKTK